MVATSNSVTFRYHDLKNRFLPQECPHSPGRLCHVSCLNSGLWVFWQVSRDSWTFTALSSSWHCYLTSYTLESEFLGPQGLGWNSLNLIFGHFDLEHYQPDLRPVPQPRPDPLRPLSLEDTEKTLLNWDSTPPPQRAMQRRAGERAIGPEEEKLKLEYEVGFLHFPSS